VIPGTPWQQTSTTLTSAALFDAVGFERAALVGDGLSGPAAIRLSVTHPDRVSALILFKLAMPTSCERTTTRGAVLEGTSIGGWPPSRKRGPRCKTWSY
jgi:pimeloyl-ACP methyl ester carboxylesterase